MRRAALGLAAAMAIAAGCATVDVRTQFDPTAPFDKYRSFFVEWHSPADEPEMGEAAAFRARAHTKLAELLEQKGYAESTADRADFVVRLQVFEQNEWLVEKEDEGTIHLEPERADTAPSSASVGTPPGDAPSPGDEVSETDALDVNSVDRDDIELGDVLVEVFDARSATLVWWGLGRSLVDPGAPDRALEPALERTLAAFPPTGSRTRKTG